MRNILTTRRLVLPLGVASALFASACGSSDSSGSDTDRFEVVASTGILGDVVEQAFGDVVDVTVIMPAGADPHDFAPSARQAEQMEEADLLVVNGAGFEEGLLDVIDAAGDSTTVFEAVDALSSPATAAAHDHGHDGDEDHGDEDHDGDEDHGDEDHDGDEDHGDEDHGDEDHGDEDHGDEDHGEHEHAEGGIDPHFWTDPTQMIEVVDALEAELTSQLGDDAADALAEGADAYRTSLVEADAQTAATFEAIPTDRRVLVTSHDVFGYFAERYDFEVVGAIIPSTTTDAEASAAELDELAALIDERSVPAIFVEPGEASGLADAVAEQAGDVAVVELFSESLGGPDSEADTYLAMLRSNADTIADALGSST